MTRRFRERAAAGLKKDNGANSRPCSRAISAYDGRRVYSFGVRSRRSTSKIASRGRATVIAFLLAPIVFLYVIRAGTRSELCVALYSSRPFRESHLRHCAPRRVNAAGASRNDCFFYPEARRAPPSSGNRCAPRIVESMMNIEKKRNYVESRPPRI